MSTYIRNIPSHDASIWKKRKPLLSRLDIELTERCNNNCIHCYINLPQNNLKAHKKELSTSEIEKILEEAAVLGCLMVRFTGGEPLLREDFSTIYRAARQLGLRVLLQSNATLITPELTALFARIPPLLPIDITVYGVTQASYEAVTQTSGSYAAAQRGMRLLLENKIPFIVRGVLLPPMAQELDEFTSWVAELPWMDQDPPITLFLNLRARRDSGEKNRRIQELRILPELALQFLTRDPQQYFKTSLEFCSKFMGPPGNRLFACGAGIGSGCVDAYGDFQPCMLLRHPDTVYDLRQGNLREALIFFSTSVRKMIPHNPNYLQKCAHCFLMGLCEQCPAKSWMEHGTLDTPVEYCCEVAHAQARTLGLLNKDEHAWEVCNWRDRLRHIQEAVGLSKP